jgi:hypothetical protein
VHQKKFTRCFRLGFFRFRFGKFKTKIRKWEFEIKIKMKEDNVGGSEVIVEPHRLTTSDEMNNGSAGGSSSASARAVVVRNATKVYGSGKNRCAVLEGLNMTIKKGDM